MHNLHRVFAFALGLSAVTVFACGSHPGGTVGDPCDEIGSSGECESGEICDDLGSGEGAYCLKKCEDHVDCDPGESCNGISGSNEKGCHPKDSSDDDETSDPKK